MTVFWIIVGVAVLVIIGAVLLLALGSKRHNPVSQIVDDIFPTADYTNPGPIAERAAAGRWRDSNEQARKAGCKVCGKQPAPHITAYGGTMGGVPYETYHCDEHKGWESWSSHRNDDGSWTYRKNVYGVDFWHTDPDGHRLTAEEYEAMMGQYRL